LSAAPAAVADLEVLDADKSASSLH